MSETQHISVNLPEEMAAALEAKVKSGAYASVSESVGALLEGESERAPLADRVTSHPSVCGGRPCIRGTRVRVADIVDLVASGASLDNILEDFPYLTREDIAATLSYAARAASHPVIRTS